MKAHHTLICVPLNGIQVKTSLVIDNPSISSRRGYSSYGIVDTKTIWFVFLLILPCWRVFFLGSPALHNAGTDRLQMVGVRSLHVDRSWLLVSKFSWSCQQCSTLPTLFEVRHCWDWILCSTLFIYVHIFFLTHWKMWIKRILLLCCIVLYCGPVFHQKKKPAEERRTKNLESHRKIVQLLIK